MDVPGEAGDGAGARRARRRHHRGRLPDRLAGRLRGRAADRRQRAAAGHRGAGADAGRRTSKRRRARSAPAERSRIHTFLATSDLHLAAQAAHHARGVPRRRRSARSSCARRFTDDVEFSAEDATRSDRDFLCRVIEAVIAAGATTVNLPDTVGYATPDEIRDFFADIIAPRAERRPRGLQRALPRRPRAGRRQQPRGDPGRRAAGRVHDQRHRRARRQRVARGDRDGAARPAGSPALRHRHSVAGAVRRRASCCATLTSEPVQANKAIVGRNAFAHEAGIHQDGVLKDARTYEIMRPEDVGQSVSSRLVLGRHSGRHAVQSRCETLGFTLDARRDRSGLPRRHRARRAPQGDRRRRPAPHRRARAHAAVVARRPRPGARRSGRLRARGLMADARDCRFQIADFRSSINRMQSAIICNLNSAICNLQ